MSFFSENDGPSRDEWDEAMESEQDNLEDEYYRDPYDD